MAQQITINDELLTRLRKKTRPQIAEAASVEFNAYEICGNPDDAYTTGCDDGQIDLAQDLIAEIDGGCSQSEGLTKPSQLRSPGSARSLPMTTTDIQMRRGKASDLIADVRRMLAERKRAAAIEKMLAEKYGVPPLTKCPGEAHQNIHQDHCGICMPHWGLVGDFVKIR